VKPTVAELTEAAAVAAGAAGAVPGSAAEARARLGAPALRRIRRQRRAVLGIQHRPAGWGLPGDRAGLAGFRRDGQAARLRLGIRPD